MINNDRGGFISSMFAIPAGIALMIGFFCLGYYVGKYQSRSEKPTEIVIPLPDISARDATKLDDFTFYKTLTDKSDRTVSIELKPKPAREAERSASSDVKTAVVPSQQKEGPAEKATEKVARDGGKQKQVASRTVPAKPAKEQVQASSNAKPRYTIQVASYPEKSLADNEVKNLKKRGYAAFVAVSEVPGKGTWYRVRLGSFSQKGAAEKLQRDLHAKEGISPIITIE